MSEQVSRLTLTSRWAFLAAMLGAAAGLVQWLSSPHEFLRGYLAAYVLWCGVPLGCGAILMTYYLVAGRWGRALRPILECGIATIPLMALLFIPVALGLRNVFPWADSARMTEAEALHHKAIYLNPPFFLARAGAFLAIWCIGGWTLAAWSRRANMDHPARRLAALSAVGLIVYCLTASFAAIDWIASLEPLWYSSVFGMYVIVGQSLTALSLCILAIVWLAPRTSDAPAAAGVLHDLGNLLLTLVVLHAYMAYVQFFIIWNGNLPYHETWYLPRTHGLWGFVSVLLILIHFALPFFALLFTRVKRNAGPMAAVAGLILVAQAVEAVWMVAPSMSGPGLRAVAPAAVMIVGIGGLWLGIAAGLWRRHLISVEERPAPEQGS